jgi:glycosyltransferase involved in cell wall biosynthesis
MGAQPLVSVLLPVYNGQLYLADAIDSILHQTYNHFEFLIINDGSTDNTDAIISSYTDPRIRYIKNEENIKLIATLNKGLVLATGKYIVRMDADDIALPERIAEQVAFMEDHPNVGVCGSGLLQIRPDGDIVHIYYPETDNQIRLRMLQDSPFAHPAVIIRKEVIGNATFNPQYLHIEDYAFWFTLSLTTKMYNLRQHLLKYRLHSAQISSVHRNHQLSLNAELRNHIFSKLLPGKSDDGYALLSNFFTLDTAATWPADKLYTLSLLLVEFVNGAKHNYNNPDVVNFIKKRFWDICCLSTQNGIMVLKAFNALNPTINLNINTTLRIKFALKCYLKKRAGK